MKDQTLISHAMSILAKRGAAKRKLDPDYREYYRQLVRKRKWRPIKQAIEVIAESGTLVLLVVLVWSLLAVYGV